MTRGFLGGQLAKNLPSNAGDTGWTPVQGTKIPQAVGQPCVTHLERPQALEPGNHACRPQQRTHMLQLRPVQPKMK